MPLSIVVDTPIDKVWARVGKTCDIGDWGFQGCEVIAGNAGKLGAFRSIGHSIIVAQGRYSYTYTQPLLATGLYPMYHGTLEARPQVADKATLYYTLVRDNSTLPDDAARQKQMENRRTLLSKMLRNMKKLSEGEALTAEDKRSPSTS